MCKQISACILLAAILLQILNRAVVYIDYYSNTAAYAKNCENKARPIMHCNGKCQMMKKLKEQEKKDSQMPERRSFNDEVVSSRSFFASLIIFVHAQNQFTTLLLITGLHTCRVLFFIRQAHKKFTSFYSYNQAV